MNLTEELQKLQQLHQSGAINDEEFSRAKARLINEPSPASGGPQVPPIQTSGTDLEQQTQQWAMFLHLSQLAGFLIPLAGLVVPIVIWQIKKSELPGIDAHGKIVVNWIISEIIYLLVCLLLILVLIGAPLLIAVGALGILFPIIGAIKANNGQVWRYPFSITVLR
ncbi:MAG: hypothetical protein RLZZ34_94 [Verrucomicrobiota bacterium]|jgi:uncharacterized Tic20 family protein